MIPTKKTDKRQTSTPAANISTKHPTIVWIFNGKTFVNLQRKNALGAVVGPIWSIYVNLVVAFQH